MCSSDLLVVVHAWDVPMGDPYGTWMPSPEMTEGIEKQAHDFVADAVAALGDATTGLDVELRVERGHPVTVTSRLADTAALLVLGTHGRGWFEGVLAGSVTAAALHDAACPVVVVRAPPDRGARGRAGGRRVVRECQDCCSLSNEWHIQ